jgi:hypothetical protein
MKLDYLTEERIAFQHASPGFLIGEEFFSGLSGFWYIRQLLMCPGKKLSCSHLRSQNGSMDDAVALEDKLNITVREAPLPTVTPGRIKLLVDTLEALEERLPFIADPTEHCDESQKADILRRWLAREAIKDEDGNYVRPRKINKRLKNEADTIRKCIKGAICKLLENPDTQDIGIYLNSNIKTGYYCEFTGKQKWIF